MPRCASYIACLDDPIADLTEDMAAEQKARVTYEHLIHQTDDPCIKDTLRFLWQREVVHNAQYGAGTYGEKEYVVWV